MGERDDEAKALEYDQTTLAAVIRMERNYMDGIGVRLSADELAGLWEQFIAGDVHDFMAHVRQREFANG